MKTKLAKIISNALPNFLSKRIRSLINHDIREFAKGGWSIGTDDIEVLTTELDRFLQYPDIKILDIGSGTSTLVFLRHTLKNHANSVLDVVEQDMQWLEKIKRTAYTHIGETNKVKFNLIHCNYHAKTGFDFKTLDTKLGSEYDIIFVDAPPDTAVADGRYLLSINLVERLKNNGVMVIHDVHRNTELYAFERLKPYFHRSELIPTKKGIGILSFPTGSK